MGRQNVAASRRVSGRGCAGRTPSLIRDLLRSPCSDTESFSQPIRELRPYSALLLSARARVGLPLLASDLSKSFEPFFYRRMA